MHARNIRLCTKRLSSAFSVCPTGATDTETGFSGGCSPNARCVTVRRLRPSGAISMVPEKYPLSRRKIEKTTEQLNTLAAPAR